MGFDLVDLGEGWDSVMYTVSHNMYRHICTYDTYIGEFIGKIIMVMVVLRAPSRVCC